MSLRRLRSRRRVSARFRSSFAAGRGSGVGTAGRASTHQGPRPGSARASLPGRLEAHRSQPACGCGSSNNPTARLRPTISSPKLRPIGFAPTFYMLGCARIGVQTRPGPACSAMCCPRLLLRRPTYNEAVSPSNSTSPIVTTSACRRAICMPTQPREKPATSNSAVKRLIGIEVAYPLKLKKLAPPRGGSRFDLRRRTLAEARLIPTHWISVPGSLLTGPRNCLGCASSCEEAASRRFYSTSRTRERAEPEASLPALNSK